MCDVWRGYEIDYDQCSLNLLVHYNDFEGVRYKILEKEVDVNFKEGRPDAPIHLAAAYSSHEILKLLIEAGADVNDREDLNGKTALFYAKDARIAEILVEAGAKANIQSQFDCQPLHSAVMGKDKLSVIKYLVLHCGVDINARTSGGMSPLQLACDYRLCWENGLAGKISLDVVKFLMKNNANVNNVDVNGNTPLVNLLKYRKPLDPEIIKIFRLVLRCSDISVNYFGGWSNRLCVSDQKLCEMLLEHVAVLISLGATLSSHEDLIKIYLMTDLGAYFEKCKTELDQAKKIKMRDSWVTLHHLLTDNKRKLKNYAGNDDLVESFRSNDWTIKFPIYGKQIVKKMEKGVEIRKLYDESCILLSQQVPIFHPTHLIVRDVLDCFSCSTKDLEKFCTE